jgi:hypothetical protein
MGLRFVIVVVWVCVLGWWLCGGCGFAFVGWWLCGGCGFAVCDVWVCVLGGCGGLRLWWLLAWVIDLGVGLLCILGSGLMVVAGFG